MRFACYCYGCPRPAAAADWLAWRRVGRRPSHPQLRTPNGRYDGPQQDRALIITYQRHRSRGAGGRHPRPVAGTGHSARNRVAQRLRMLQDLWTSRRAASWRSWRRRGRSGTAPAAAFTPLGPRQSAAFSTAFSPSG